MKVAIIPARGGSKRIPRKNIRDFSGQPMLAYSLQAAVQADIFDHIYISTDDPEIADVASDFGAEQLELRPANLSDEYATTVDVMAFEVDKLLLSYSDLQAVCCIYATAPFISSEDIALGAQTLFSKEVDYCFAVASYSFPIQRAIALAADKSVEMFYPEHRLTRSQDLASSFHDAGQFYWGKPEAWLEKKPIYSRHSKALVVPHYRVQDIDTEEDWVRAEAMYMSLKSLGELD